MQIVLDIENTVINNLNSCDFLQDNCDRIRRFIKNNKPRFVHLFTWGWKEPDDILHSVVDCIYDRLGVDKEQRGVVYTKSDSVAYAIDRCWLKKEDREEVLHPGMMAAYGLGKIHLVTEQFASNDLSKYMGEDYVIIDDLVTDEEHMSLPYHNILLMNPERM